MQETEPLPVDAIAALHEGRKIDAIRSVRVARSLELKEAKDVVDAYIRNDAALRESFAERQTRAKQGLMRGAVVLALLVLAYWLLDR